jgi:hypothetical protein
MRMPSDKEVNQPVSDIDPEFGKMTIAMGQLTWSIKHLSQREKSLICTMYDICFVILGSRFRCTFKSVG